MQTTTRLTLGGIEQCQKHDGRNAETCAVCRTVAEINATFAALTPAAPRYRYWRIKRSKGKSERTFEYTTETADGGKFWAIERRWVKVAGGERGKIVRKLGFKVRAKAKARAYAWYQKASR